MYAENRLRAASSQSGIARNHDSKGIPEVEITENGSAKLKPGSEGSKIPHIPQIPTRNEVRRSQGYGSRPRTWLLEEQGKPKVRTPQQDHRNRSKGS
jgi:hypothetical protein